MPQKRKECSLFFILGEYNYLINIKGLLIIPAKLWEFLGEKFVITRGLGGYLFYFFIVYKLSLLSDKIYF